MTPFAWGALTVLIVPWYADGPTAERAADMYPRCSYLLDVPPSLRPEGARPLIPLEVVSR